MCRALLNVTIEGNHSSDGPNTAIPRSMKRIRVKIQIDEAHHSCVAKGKGWPSNSEHQSASNHVRIRLSLMVAKNEEHTVRSGKSPRSLGVIPHGIFRGTLKSFVSFSPGKKDEGCTKIKKRKGTIIFRSLFIGVCLWDIRRGRMHIFAVLCLLLRFRKLTPHFFELLVCCSIERVSAL
jgi:hypothetical protein